MAEHRGAVELYIRLAGIFGSAGGVHNPFYLMHHVILGLLKRQHFKQKQRGNEAIQLDTSRRDLLASTAVD